MHINLSFFLSVLSSNLSSHISNMIARTKEIDDWRAIKDGMELKSFHTPKELVELT